MHFPTVTDTEDTSVMYMEFLLKIASYVLHKTVRIR